ncbi:hypothetical protein SS1G_06920 [Sclerotinia sclerotiorum 1980 UF-70]|uniref:Rhodopsin domain-containing protein n=1 Tax=Sclerotinia sclerotiorum (strain ATCC 18683 / 1980 / Ss-1) TaxID=665079 RepID=A7ENM1_SCLS1|nr:hypothetical protein SS1G_06920 [Sclerotinia sclerotiorum 1980 UF-70]EDO04437.1 hypothetical protein SS1G_06920 [Sclerotinia sclerotiorum 1980 UF-70]
MSIPGVEPGLVPQYIGYQMQSTVIAFMVLSIIFVSLRIFARYVSGSRAGIDDILIIPAIVCYLGQGVTGLSSFLALILCSLLQCAPLAYLWNKSGHPGGHCFDTGAFWRYGSLPNLITDLAMLVLPLPCIWRLKLSQKDKVGLLFTFITGSMNLFRTFKERAGLTTRGSTQNTWGSKKESSGMELPSRLNVKSTLNGFEELSDEELISQRISKNNNSIYVQAMENGHREDSENQNSSREIRVQRDVIIDTVSR